MTIPQWARPLTLTVATLGALTFAMGAHAALKEGDKAPEFSTQASLAGRAFTFSLKDALRKGPVVVYFYPSAYTNGCNIQAHIFATTQDRFRAANATVVGVSLDSIARLNDFSADPEYCAGKVPVASDESGKIARSFDVNIRDASPGRKDTRGQEISHGFAERTTFVIAPDGRIAATIGGVSPSSNVEQALVAVERLANTRP